MKNWQFAIICGLLLLIYRQDLQGINGHFTGMVSGLITGYGVFLWWNRSDKTKE